MKLIYCSSISYPSKFANRIQTLSMAKEFANLLGKDFYLGGNDIKITDGNFSAQVVNFYRLKSFILAWQYLVFINKNQINIVYCREHKLLYFIILYNKIFFRMKLKFVYEAHLMPDRIGVIFSYVIKNSHKIIVITKIIGEELRNIGIAQDCIGYFPDGVDLSLFEDNLDKQSLRLILNLPTDKYIVAYVGSIGLYDWKGVDVLLDANKKVSLKNVVILIVGGSINEVEVLNNRYKEDNVIFVGQKEHADAIRYIRASDILSLPNKGNNDISKKYTSPMKLFEYMASGNPIIASDLPAIKEILNQDNAFLIKAGDSSSLADVISSVLNNFDQSKNVGSVAKHDVLKYTWHKRVVGILNFINK